MKIVVTKDYTEMCKLASRIFAAQITLKPDSVLGLATGSTPVGMYKELIQMYNEGRVDFSHVKTVNLDEYAGLNGDNDQSYRYFMNHNLFDHININKENTSVPCGTAEDLQAECERYEQLVEQTGGVDIQLLGIGNNGHIAFNEPCEEFPEKNSCGRFDPEHHRSKRPLLRVDGPGAKEGIDHGHRHHHEGKEDRAAGKRSEEGTDHL